MGNRRVFWRVRKIVLFGRHRKVKRSLESLYRAKRRVHSEMKPTFAKTIYSCSFYHVNIKHPSIYILYWIISKTLLFLECVHGEKSRDISSRTRLILDLQFWRKRMIQNSRYEFSDSVIFFHGRGSENKSPHAWFHFSLFVILSLRLREIKSC